MHVTKLIDHAKLEPQIFAALPHNGVRTSVKEM